MKRLTLTTFALTGVLALSLSACGGSDGTTTASTSAGSTASSTAGAEGQGGGGGMSGVDFTAVQQCLSAAGISVPTPSGTMGARPSGAPTGMPTDRPSGAPTGGPGGGMGGGGMGSVLQSTEAQAALKACGITLPTGGPNNGSTSAPTPTSTSN